MRSLIIYNSQHGKTRLLAKEIGQQLKSKDVDVKTISISEFTDTDLVGVDMLLLGSWTKGLFFFAQKPDTAWVEFASGLPDLSSTKIALFTTYGIATGSMFRKMAKSINKDLSKVLYTIKSKTGYLGKKDVDKIQHAI